MKLWLKMFSMPTDNWSSHSLICLPYNNFQISDSIHKLEGDYRMHHRIWTLRCVELEQFFIIILFNFPEKRNVFLWEAWSIQICEITLLNCPKLWQNEHVLSVSLNLSCGQLFHLYPAVCVYVCAIVIMWLDEEMIKICSLIFSNAKCRDDV